MKGSSKKHNAGTNCRQPVLRFALILALVSTVSTFALGQEISNLAPANDSFASPQVLSSAGGTLTTTNVDATKEQFEPSHAENRGGASIWFRYDATSNGVLVVDTLGSSINTLLAVYQGTSFPTTKLVGANDNLLEPGISGAASRVRIGIAAGNSYYIAVDGWYNQNTGTLSTGPIQLNYAVLNVVANDNFSNAWTLHPNGHRLTVSTNAGASKEPGEPDHVGNAGGRSIWYKWESPHSYPVSYTFSVGMVNTTAASSRTSLLAVYSGSSVGSLTLQDHNVFARLNRVTFIAAPSTPYYIAIDGLDNGSGAATGTFTINYGPTKNPRQADFDADGRADLSVYRPTTGTWYSLDSSDSEFKAEQFGLNGDRPRLMDDDNDGESDLVIFRPDTATWYKRRSSAVGNAVYASFVFGLQTDIPLTGNFVDQTTNREVVFRPTEGSWWMRSANGSADLYFWGQNGDVPILVDFTGDGEDDLGVFRTSNGTWYVRDLANETTQSIQFGVNGDKPVPADYDGDGFVDIAVYRPSSGTWWIRRSSNGSVTATNFGLSNDVPQPADYDGDYKDDIAIYRNGVWWVLQSSNGVARAYAFGISTDIPLASAVR